MAGELKAKKEEEKKVDTVGEKAEVKEETRPAEKAKVVEMKSEEVVTITRGELGAIMEQLNRLSAVVDKSKLQWYDKEHKPKDPQRYRLNAFDDKESGVVRVVLGWRMIIDDVYVDGMGIAHSKQVIRLILEESKTAEMNYLDFIRRLLKQDSELVGKTMDSDGNTILELKRITDGKIFKVDATYIN